MSFVHWSNADRAARCAGPPAGPQRNGMEAAASALERLAPGPDRRAGTEGAPGPSGAEGGAGGAPRKGTPAVRGCGGLPGATGGAA